MTHNFEGLVAHLRARGTATVEETIAAYVREGSTDATSELLAQQAEEDKEMAAVRQAAAQRRPSPKRRGGA